MVGCRDAVESVAQEGEANGPYQESLLRGWRPREVERRTQLSGLKGIMANPVLQDNRRNPNDLRSFNQLPWGTTELSGKATSPPLRGTIRPVGTGLRRPGHRLNLHTERSSARLSGSTQASTRSGVVKPSVNVP